MVTRALVHAVLGIVAVTSLATAATIETIAGGPGSGLATTLAQKPWGLHRAGGHLYVADFSNAVVRRIELATLQETVVAGNGIFGTDGIPGPATGAELQEPIGVAVDGAGNLFVLDNWDGRIRRVNAATGVMTYWAGSGATGFSGDGGPALAAAFSGPHSIAADAAGNLFITDTSNKRIRRVDAVTQIITTIAGGGMGGLGDGGPATAAELSAPVGISVTSGGHLLIADSLGRRVRRVDGGTGIITTIAGTGTSGYTGDGGPATAATFAAPELAVEDPAGNVVVTDTLNHAIRRIDAGTGIVTTVAGIGAPGGFTGDGGPATAARLNQPFAAVTDADGSILIGDFLNHRLRRVDAATGVITTIAGTGFFSFGGDGGPALQSEMAYIWDVATDAAGNTFVAHSEGVVRRIDAVTGVITTYAGTGTIGNGGDGGLATAAQLGTPLFLAVLPDGDLLIADNLWQRVRRVDAATGIITPFAGVGPSISNTGDGGPATAANLWVPGKISADGDGNVLIAVRSRIRRVDGATGIITTIAGTDTPGFSGDGGAAAAALLAYPSQAIAAADGTIYVADGGNRRIRRIDPATTVITTIAGTGDVAPPNDGVPALTTDILPNALLIDPFGALLVADATGAWIRRIDLTSTTITRIAGFTHSGFAGDGGPATNALLSVPTGFALDTVGGLLIADTGNRRVRRLSTTYEPVCGNGLIDPGEECDDGNPVGDDGCTLLCTVQAGWTCTGSPSVCTFACAAAPRVCDWNATASSKLQLRDHPDDTRDKLAWKWRFPSHVASPFGNPLGGTGYGLCIYDAGGRRLSARVAAGGTCNGRPCWSAPKGGYRYSNSLLTPDGIKTLKIKTGGPTGDPRIDVKGKGLHLDMPGLPLVPPVVAQLTNDDDATCWSATFSTTLRNEDGFFKANAD